MRALSPSGGRAQASTAPQYASVRPAMRCFWHLPGRLCSVHMHGSVHKGFIARAAPSDHPGCRPSDGVEGEWVRLSQLLCSECRATGSTCRQLIALDAPVLQRLVGASASAVQEAAAPWRHMCSHADDRTEQGTLQTAWPTAHARPTLQIGHSRCLQRCWGDGRRACRRAAAGQWVAAGLHASCEVLTWRRRAT